MPGEGGRAAPPLSSLPTILPSMPDFLWEATALAVLCVLIAACGLLHKQFARRQLFCRLHQGRSCITPLAAHGQRPCNLGSCRINGCRRVSDPNWWCRIRSNDEGHRSRRIMSDGGRRRRLVQSAVCDVLDVSVVCKCNIFSGTMSQLLWTAARMLRACSSQPQPSRTPPPLIPHRPLEVALGLTRFAVEATVHREMRDCQWRQTATGKLRRHCRCHNRDPCC